MRYEQVLGGPHAFRGRYLMRGPPPPPAPGVAPTVPPVPAVPAADAAEARLAALVARMAARDEAALAAFYDATAARAYGMALRVTGNAALAEEVVADAFHQAWRDAGRYDRNRSRPATWLLMICRSRALDALRARDPAVAHEDPDTLVADEDRPRGGDPLDLLAAADARHALHAALAALPAAQRQMLALAFFRDCTHQEIAAQARLPLGTVKSQIRRALAALRHVLAADSGAH